MVCVCVYFTASTENISGRKQNIRRKKWMARENSNERGLHIYSLYTLLYSFNFALYKYITYFKN